jgi:hypothetical protein
MSLFEAPYDGRASAVWYGGRENMVFLDRSAGIKLECCIERTISFAMLEKTISLYASHSGMMAGGVSEAVNTTR